MAPITSTPNRFFDEHFNKYHPIGPSVPKKTGAHKVYQKGGSAYRNQNGQYKNTKISPSKKPVDHRLQHYSVSNFEPEFFKQFYDESEKHFIPFNRKYQPKRKRKISEKKDPKKFAFPNFETF